MPSALCFAPPSAFAYPDARGAPELRRALASYLRRVRGVVVEPESIVVCAGATQGLALLGRALVRQGMRAIAVEDPGLPPHRAVLAYAGLEVEGAPVDGEGIDVSSVDARAVLTTPAHRTAPRKPASFTPSVTGSACWSHVRPASTVASCRRACVASACASLAASGFFNKPMAM